MATLEDIKAKIAKLQAEADAIVRKQSSAVSKISELMEKHGLTLADLQAHLVASRRSGNAIKQNAFGRPSSAAKYLDPKTGATWTGRGRAPGWIVNAKDRSNFLIDGRAQLPTRNAASGGRKGNYVRGPQAPKYRDPATGATWSGRGRAPAWLADAKDRTEFLISGNGNGARRVTTEKKVAVKRRVVKQGATKKAAPKTNAAKKVDAATDASN
ncbi:MAG TPA: H-NS family nucleoid-associated regulatory protein [Trinickia sp.]|uniref:H-NS family nucleoid-associated regulatory protein n=1 Tax=Trinickia sp. TaxID=2571163 RepID=UPI002F40A41E